MGASHSDTSALRVAVEAPRHASIESLLDYESVHPHAPGTLVRVPLGRREVAGIVWEILGRPAGEPGSAPGASGRRNQGLPNGADGAAAFEVRPIVAALESLPPLDAAWRALVAFAAQYYQRGVGELALAVLPPQLRTLDDAQLRRRLAALEKEASRAPAVAPATTAAGAAPGVDEAADGPDAPPLNAEQHAAVQALGEGIQPALLHGVTGSGKTEVYLRLAQAALQRGGQVLVLVPEINLTPQLEARFAARFPTRHLASLHSGLTPPQRLRHWLAAHLGRAELVLGTRLAIFASMPRLALIVVDEEHDPSYKQQEGARYSARDLAVWRANQLGIPVVLGSATPSLETWHRVLEKRYRRVVLAERIGGGALPRVRVLDTRGVARADPALPLAPALLAALTQRLERGEQSLLLLNRRGYAEVLQCTACGWKSACAYCSAWRVFHKVDRTLRCHHCGYTERVPRACPECGNLDITPLGRGTEKLEEQLAQVLPAARIGRIDADTTRASGELGKRLAAAHAGEFDVLVGTQILAKGHDFRRVTLVVAVNPDGALFSSDFRAPERLFALLMQAAGRAGRDAAQAERAEMWIQTGHPTHPLYDALIAHDYERFAAQQLREREGAGLPPYSSLALLRAEAREAQAAAAFLREAAPMLAQPGVTVHPPVPPVLARVAEVERMQMLLESPSRPLLQRVLATGLPRLHELRRAHRALLRWAVDVDPLAI